MANVSMVVWQVKEARKAVAAGESVQGVADRLKLSYGPVYTAVRGQTWASITNPPPITKGMLLERRKRPMRECQNCGRKYRVGGTTIRCERCSAHWYRHGTERNSKHLHKHPHARLSDAELGELYQRYLTGISTDDLAETLPFSAETLRRRLHGAGYKLRCNAGMKQQLTPSLVRWARERVHLDGVPVNEVAVRLDMNYQTVYSAVMGMTWRSAGGPLPETEGEKRPCLICGLLTAHESGKCRYCR